MCHRKTKSPRELLKGGARRITLDPLLDTHSRKSYYKIYTVQLPYEFN